MYAHLREMLFSPAIVIFLSMPYSAIANAADTDELLYLLQQQAAQIEALTAQVNALVERVGANDVRVKAADANASQAVTVASDFASNAAASDRIQWTGDFRYRYENIDDASKPSDRDRNRIRARASLHGKINDDLKIVLGLATGGDDPVSSNQTLGGGGSTKAINLDLAYFDWTVRPGLKAFGGKFKNILHRVGKNGLLWDGDWNPEGIGLRYDGDRIFAAALGTWLESDSARGDTEFSFALQSGIKATLGNAKITAGVGYYDIGTAGKGSFFGDVDEFFGNSFDPATNTYLFDYQEIEGFVEVGLNVRDVPLKIFADYLRNVDADDLDTAYAAGIQLGSAKQQGSWQMAYIYQDVEADAVFGLLTDSDFAGGGSGGRGHIFKGAYAVNDRTALKFTYFLTEKNRHSNTAVPADFDRVQLDVAFKY